MFRKHGVDVPETGLRQNFEQFVATQRQSLASRTLQQALLNQCSNEDHRLELLDFLIQKGADIKYVIEGITGPQGSRTHIYAVQYCAERFRISQEQARRQLAMAS